MGSEPARSCGRRRPEPTQFGHLRVAACAPRARARRRAWVPWSMDCTSTSARAGALMASRFAGSQSTTPTPECAQTTTICGQRGFAPPNGTHLRQLQGDRACAVARKLTRKGWPLAANPWRALRKCNVRRGSPAAKPLYHRDNLPSEHAHSCGRRRPEPTAAVVRKQRERTNSCQ